jgi:lipopolysaccharide biosynthesis protein
MSFKEEALRLIAFYLPQFHPIPENDLWWGEGFTEWTNVTRATALFPDHYQPHQPAELGYYDLRDPEVRLFQAQLAEQYGIYGFCYYHYWFEGKRLLEQPFNEVHQTGQPDYPFCLCWANESWTRNWDGGAKELLIGQRYSPDDDRNHIRWLASPFSDRRYIRVDGKPLLLVYRANRFPDPRATTDIWRDEAHKMGLGELYLCRVESFPDEHGDPKALGFDAAVEFQPDWSQLPLHRKLLRRLSIEVGFKYDDVYDYESYVDRMLAKKQPDYRLHPCLTPGWDNSARRKVQTTILHQSTPDIYEKWLRAIIQRTNAAAGEKLVFINAWNEWGEGCHLEPCQRWGRAYLESTRKVVQEMHAQATAVTPQS